MGMFCTTCNTGLMWVSNDGTRCGACINIARDKEHAAIIKPLELKVTQMREEHEEKLTELQDAQRAQLKVVKQNEDILQQMVDSHQLTISGLNDQNSQLSTTNKMLLQNQQMMTAFMSKASGEYSKIMSVVCKKFETLNLMEGDEYKMLVDSIEKVTTYPKLLTS